MADLRPFRAFRPRPDIAPRVACPPYDVIDTSEARELARDNPFSFLHVTRPEIDLPDGTDEHADAVYAKGRENLEALVSDGVLVQDGDPHFYVYAQSMPITNGTRHEQVGVVGCASVADYLSNRIKKHEKTRADKEDDRTRHIDELAAHDEPVFLTYRASPDIDSLVAGVRRQQALYDFTTDDGVGHKLWAVDGDRSRALANLFDAVEPLYVADGHHRSAAAARVHQKNRGDGGEHNGFLAVVFPHDQMHILAYNRLVRDPEARSSEALLKALSSVLDLSPAETPAPSAPKSFGIYVGKKWYLARVRPGSFDATDPVKSLDCSICQDQILGPLFQVDDPRRDKHLDFVGGIRGAKELERRVDSGEMSLAIHLYPTSITELMQVSDAGLLMPPKSTWFEPKLRSGLFVHTF